MSSSNFKSTKVTDLTRGMKFVEKATDGQLVDAENADSGVKVDNILNLRRLPRYTKFMFEDESNPVNISTLAGDLFSAVAYLNHEMKVIRSQLEILTEKDSEKESPKKESPEKETPPSDVLKRIEALEENLRCLRESLTRED